jgi:hypothetical protein
MGCCICEGRFTEEQQRGRRAMRFPSEKRLTVGGDSMELKILPYRFTVCKLSKITDMNWNGDFFFVGRTDEELSLVCKTEDAPSGTIERDDGWRGFRIQGVLDFSLIGILSRLSGVLAENKIGIFAVSTYNTDYILVKEENLDRAKEALNAAGYTVI